MTIAAPATTERPILFSGEMVRAILEGRKTQTRRVVVPTQSKPRVAPLRMEPWIIDGEQQEDDYGAPAWAGFHPEYWGEAKWFTCPYGQVGDRLWVRETWRPCAVPQCSDTAICVEYRESDYCKLGHLSTLNRTGWRPSIFMPRKACRLELIVLEVHLVLLQDITGHEVITEGIPPLRIHQPDVGRTGRGPLLDAFASGWDKINGKRAKGAYAWDKNPWVWDIHYKRATRLRGE